MSGPSKFAWTVGAGSGRRKKRAKKKVVAARPAASKGRVFCLLVGIASLALGFGWRLVDLQLMPDVALAEEVGSKVIEVEIAAPRGEILDRYGRPIAFSLPRPTIIANPRMLQSADVQAGDRDLLGEAVDALSALLSTDRETLRSRLGADKAFAYLERQVDPEVGEAVLELKLAGVYVVTEQRREHPHGECSGIGIVGRVDLDQVGISGMELEYEDQLSGKNGIEVRQSQAGGEVQLPGGSQVIEPMVPGKDITLTLDRNIQLEAETLLIDALEAVEGDLAMVIVTIPGTGEILAMANVSRDPETGIATCTTNNLGATHSYEPGSIMKSLTFASVFENDAWPEATAIQIPRKLEIDLGRNTRNHVYVDENVPPEGEPHTPGWVLRKSSNNGTIMMAQELGPTNLYNSFVDFGLGATTSLELPGEASGILDPLDSNALELGNAAIGQGVAVTPLQMLLAYNTLANGGLHVDPVLSVDEIGTAAPERIVSSATAETVMGMMTGVVLDGTGKRGAIVGYKVSGKTGTAWQPCGSGYLCPDGISRHLTASFAGIVSNDNGPALSVIVVIDNPSGVHTGGGDAAAPVFADLARYALRQLRIPPLSDVVVPEGRVHAAAAQPIVASGTEDDSLEES